MEGGLSTFNRLDLTTWITVKATRGKPQRGTVPRGNVKVYQDFRSYICNDI